MRAATLVFPGELATRTGGYIYDRRAFAALAERGWQVDYASLPPSFPFPDSAALAAADAALAAVSDGRTTVVDGLAFGAMPEVAARHRHRLDLVALVHHPLCLETGLDPVQAERLRHSEHRALAQARHVICTSPLTAGTLSGEFGVPVAALTVALPGVDRAAPAQGSGGTPCLLCVGTLTARKGHTVLLDALAPLRDLAWWLLCVGSTERDPATAAAVRAKMAELGLGERVNLAGELDGDALEAAYAGADLVVSASFYEGYGMALAEALARGLPVVTTRAGAAADTVPPGAGLFVAPGDAGALSSAIRSFLTDGALRQALRAGARRAGAALGSWADTAAAIERALLSSPP